MAKPKKPKKVNYVMIPDVESKPWNMLAEMVAANHPHLTNAKITLVWRRSLKRDKDGLLVLGKCKKASDLDKETVLARSGKECDFVIILNEEAWHDLSDEQREALIDHELCHAQVARDKDGIAKKDERGRTVYRSRKHDIEEFREIVERHGLYKKDLEEFVKAARKKRETPLFDEPNESGNGSASRRPASHAASRN